MVRDLKDVVQSVEKRVDLHAGDLVVDIGCNDCTLFKFYSTPWLAKVGFDPSNNISCESHGDYTYINDYFSYDKFPYKDQRAKVITAIAMFYDLEDINSFLQDVKKLLDDDGLFVIQLTDLYGMMRLSAFDNLCHEHLEYYSLDVLSKIMLKNGFVITEVETNKVNGWSIRLYIKKSGEPSESVVRYLQEEKEFLHSLSF
jgi:predicted TPR repeat methyltransferase